MGQFSGSVICTEPANHVFVFHHVLLEDYGLCNMNIPSLKALQYSEEYEYKKILGMLNGGGVDWNASYPNIFTWLSSQFQQNGNWYYWEAGQEDYTQVTISSATLLQLMEFHDKSDEDQEAEVNKRNYRKQISRIQHSRDGYVRQADKTDNSQYAIDQMGYAFKFHIRLYFLNRTLQNNQRTLANKTSNLFAGTPRRHSGATFSASKSREAPVGVYDGVGITDTSEEGDQAVGPLLTVWNENLGGFQSPGPFLARLLEDIASANIPLINLDTGNTLDRDPDDFFTGVNNSSNATFGYASPFSVHNGNPKSFGPNFNKCEDKTNVEKIQVVNRSNFAFKQGEVVLVYPIDGEFIIGKFSQLSSEPIPLALGRVGFYQYIATSDEFFRPYATPAQQDAEDPKAFNYLLPDDVLNAVRWSIYGDRNATGAGNDPYNGVKSITGWHKTAPLNPYFQIYPWHIPQPKYINTFSYPEDDLRGLGATSDTIPLWWGPVFTEGVSAGYFSGDTSGVFVNSFDYSVVDGDHSLPSESSFDSLNTPAALASSGPYGVGFPFEDTYGFIRQYNNTMLLGTIGRGYSKNPATHVAPSGIGDGGTLERINSAYGVSATNAGNILFQLCPAEYIGICDLGSSDVQALAPNAPGVLAGTDRNCRILWDAGAVNWSNLNRLTTNVSADDARGIIRQAITYRETYFSSMPAYAGDGTINDFEARISRDVAGTTLGQHYFYNKNAGPAAFKCFPYDAYVRLNALNRPKDTNALWGGDGKLATTLNNQQFITSRIGANAVGITVMRQKFAQGGSTGGTISLDTDGLYGVRGRSFGLGSSTNVTLSIIGALFIGGFGSSSVDTRGLTSAYGSNVSDAFYSFGTAGIFVRIYDAWPDQDTIAVPQYYTLLHFNPSTYYGVTNGVLNASDHFSINNPYADQDILIPNRRSDCRQARKEVRYYRLDDGEVVWDDLNILIDLQDEDFPPWLKERGSTDYLDFYEPVQAGYIEVIDPDDSNKKVRYRANLGAEGVALPLGIFTSGTYLRPMDEWRLNTSRRGQFISEHGYTYRYKSLGVSRNGAYVAQAGTNFVPDQILTGRNGIQIKVGTVGAAGQINNDWSIHTTDFETSAEEEIQQMEAGTGISPGDLPFSISIAPEGGGDFAEFIFPSGLCYLRFGKDIGPKSLVNPTRLTLGSGQGKIWTEGQRNTTIAMAPTEGVRYQGQYEAVFFVQNDVTMATTREQNSTSGTPRLQFFTLNTS
jgi:hypothetical protein